MNPDIIKHVRGESVFIDDMPVPEGTLYASVFSSSIAHGKIKNIFLQEALSSEGVKAILTFKDIPGENQIGNVIQDEHLLAEDEVEYIGEPVAIVVADSKLNADKAKTKIKIFYDELPIITDPREAAKQGKLIVPPVIFTTGNTHEGFDKSTYITEDKVEIGGQEHLYLETQAALSILVENNLLKVFSSTQSPTVVQKTIARVLGLNMNNVEVDVLRLGGGFGGKEDQATSWAAISALAAYKLKKPVKLVLNRHEDIKLTGKRHPYSADFKIGINDELKIIAYEVKFYQNAGAFADLSTAILERTLFHATNSYYIPHVKAIGYSCKTNLPPNTAFRGFGGPQGMFVIESAIHKAADFIGVDAFLIQEKNLLRENDFFYFGQVAKKVNASACMNEAKTKYNFEEKIKSVNIFNSQNVLSKKGIALMPICFGISFTSTFLNQASALVHIFTDGSVSISTAAVEMGQGVNEKIRKVAANELSINPDRIKIETTNTTRVANTSPTAASSAADLNGNAVIIACSNLKERLFQHAKMLLDVDDKSVIEIKNEKIYLNNKITSLEWKELISSCYLNRISLSSQAYYATPDIYFDRQINKGNPFAYHVYGTAIISATVDCLRGNYKIDSVEVVHDFGKSIDETIDIGQAEGAIIQGLGWITMEELIQNDNGILLSNSLSTYKIPDIHFTPEIFEIAFLKNSENDYGPMKSKAIGEPPFMYGIGGYFAILNAVKSFNKKTKNQYNLPFTPEKVLMLLYTK
jgi:xanthine dehydrogenase large subunit